MALGPDGSQSTVKYLEAFQVLLVYDMIRHDMIYKTCAYKLTDSQLSLPHGVISEIYRRRIEINKVSP